MVFQLKFRKHFAINPGAGDGEWLGDYLFRFPLPWFPILWDFFCHRFWIFLLLQSLQFMIKQTLQHLPHINRQQDLSHTNSPHNMDKSYIHKHYKICVRLL